MNFEFDVTTNFDKHYKSKTKIIISQGGGRSGKTYAILQCLILKALREKNVVISVVAENMPFIKRGALRDFKLIMISAGLWNDKNFNKTESIYTFFTGSVIEFFSVETTSRALGSARDYLFINECNNVKYETTFQLMARTKKQIYLDFNPLDEFYVHTEIIQNKEFSGQWEFIQTTFYGNEMLDETIKQTMLARAAKDDNYKRVYIDGEIGKQEGLIITNYKLIDDIPQDIKKKANVQYFGLDWGYSNDPASLNEIYVFGDSKQPVQDIYINEIFYEPKLMNKTITTKIKENIIKPNYKIVADNSEPKSIDEIFSYGVNIIGVEKGAGSIQYGLNLLKQANIYITKSSYNTIKEFRNYKWATNKHGEPLKDSKGNAIPIDLWNHSIDNIRYVAMHVNDLKFQYRTVPRNTPNRNTRSGLVPI